MPGAQRRGVPAGPAAEVDHLCRRELQHLGVGGVDRTQPAGERSVLERPVGEAQLAAEPSSVEHLARGGRDSRPYSRSRAAEGRPSPSCRLQLTPASTWQSRVPGAPRATRRASSSCRRRAARQDRGLSPSRRGASTASPGARWLIGTSRKTSVIRRRSPSPSSRRRALRRRPRRVSSSASRPASEQRRRELRVSIPTRKAGPSASSNAAASRSASPSRAADHLERVRHPPAGLAVQHQHAPRRQLGLDGGRERVAERGGSQRRRFGRRAGGVSGSWTRPGGRLRDQQCRAISMSARERRCRIIRARTPCPAPPHSPAHGPSPSSAPAERVGCRHLLDPPAGGAGAPGPSPAASRSAGLDPEAEQRLAAGGAHRPEVGQPRAVRRRSSNASARLRGGLERAAAPAGAEH